MKTEKDLFELCKALGAGEHKTVSLLHHESNAIEGFRAYTTGGNAFDIEHEFDYDEEEYFYSFFDWSEFQDGFRPITLAEAIALIEEVKK